MTTQVQPLDTQIHLIAVCYTCTPPRRHTIQASARDWTHALMEWQVKHPGHNIEFRSPKRTIPKGLRDASIYPLLDAGWEPPWWLEQFAENADVKIAYVSSAAYTLTLASLGTSSTFTSGRQSTVVDNTGSVRLLDYLVGGKATTGTSPTTAKSIRIYVFGSDSDSPTYPDQLGGTDAARSFTTENHLNQIALLGSLSTDGTSDQTYYLAAKAISVCFAGALPKYHGLYVAHDTAVNLNSTGSNHAFTNTGVYATSG